MGATCMGRSGWVVVRGWAGVAALLLGWVGPDSRCPRFFLALPFLGKSLFGGGNVGNWLHERPASGSLLRLLLREDFTQRLVMARRSNPTKSIDVSLGEGKALPQVHPSPTPAQPIFRPFTSRFRMSSHWLGILSQNHRALRRMTHPARLAAW